MNVSVILSRVLQRLSRIGSPITRLLLSGGTHRLMSRRLLLLRFIGRKTGRTYVTPVSYVQEGDQLLVPGGGRWWKNLMSGPVTVRLRGKWLPVASQVIDEPQAMADVLGRMMAANRALSVLTGIRRGTDGRPDSRSLERERNRGFVIVRLMLQEETAADVLERSVVA